VQVCIDAVSTARSSFLYLQPAEARASLYRCGFNRPVFNEIQIIDDYDILLIMIFNRILKQINTD
jgi:hypothetical protein